MTEGKKVVIHIWYFSTQPAEVGIFSPYSAEVALPWPQSEINFTLFLFTSHSFLANNLCFMVKLIEKTMLINVKYMRMREKRLYSSNKEGLPYWDKRILEIFLICTDKIPGENQIPNLKTNKQMLPVPNWLLDCVIFLLF